MAEIDWNKLVIEGRAISQGVPLPEGITHISQMEVAALDADSLVPDSDTMTNDTMTNDLTKKEIKAVLTEAGIEFTEKMTRNELLALVPAPVAPIVTETESTGPKAPEGMEEDETIVTNPETSDGNDSDTL